MELASNTSPTSSLFASRLKIKPTTGPPISLSPSPSNNMMSKMRASSANPASSSNVPSSSSSLARRFSSTASDNNMTGINGNGGVAIPAPQEYVVMRQQRPTTGNITANQAGSTSSMNSQTLFANIRNGISAAASGASPKFLRGRKVIYSNENVHDREDNGIVNREDERDSDEEVGELEDTAGLAKARQQAQQRVLMSRSMDSAERMMLNHSDSQTPSTSTSTTTSSVSSSGSTTITNNRLFPTSLSRNTSSSSLSSTTEDTTGKELPSLTSSHGSSTLTGGTTSLFSKVGIAASGFGRSSATPSPSPSPTQLLSSAGSSSSSLLPSVNDPPTNKSDGFMTLFNRKKAQIASTTSPATATAAISLLTANSLDSDNSPRIIASHSSSLDPSPRDDALGDVMKPVSLRPSVSRYTQGVAEEKSKALTAAFTAAVLVNDSDGEEGGDDGHEQHGGSDMDEGDFKSKVNMAESNMKSDNPVLVQGVPNSKSGNNSQQGKNALKKMPAQQPASPVPRRVRFSDPISFSSTGSAMAKTKFDALNTILRLTSGNTTLANEEAGSRSELNTDGEVKGILRVKMSGQYAALLHHHNSTQQQVHVRGNAAAISSAPPPNLFSVVSPISSTINTINTMNNTLSNKNLSVNVSQVLTPSQQLSSGNASGAGRNPRDSMVQKSLQDIHRKLGINQPLPTLQANAMQFAQPFTNSAQGALLAQQQQQQQGQSSNQVYRQGTPLPRRPNTASSTTTTTSVSNNNNSSSVAAVKPTSLSLNGSRPQSASSVGNYGSQSPSLDDMLNAPLFTLSVKLITLTAANGIAISCKPTGPVLFFANHCSLPWSPTSADREKGLTDRGIFLQYRDSSTVNLVGSKLKIKSTTVTPIFFGACNSADSPVLVMLEMMPSTNYQAVKERLIPMILSQSMTK